MIGPVIQIDTREKRPLCVSAFPVERATLPVGDYSIKGFSNWDRPEFIVERKSLDDLAASFTTGRARFGRELQKMRAFRFAALLLEATSDQVTLHQYRSRATPQSIMASLVAVQVRNGIHIVWGGDPADCATWLEGAVRQFARGREKDFAALYGNGAVAAARRPVL